MFQQQSRGLRLHGWALDPHGYSGDDGFSALLQPLHPEHPIRQTTTKIVTNFMTTHTIESVMLIMQEVYVSTDIESDGPIPGPNSMLSFGSVALTEDGEEIGSFSRNLELLSGASGDLDTMAWWKTQPEAWVSCRQSLISPEQAMREFVEWVGSLNGKPVFVAYPAGFDFLFVYWYLMKFVGKSPFSFSAIDVKSFAMALMRKPYRDCTKRNMPKHWFPKNASHTHVALDDAREQGLMFINMLRESKRSRPCL